jgi:hypothetical protein
MVDSPGGESYENDWMGLSKAGWQAIPRCGCDDSCDTSILVLGCPALKIVNDAWDTGTSTGLF